MVVAPVPDGFVRNRNTFFNRQILNISMAQIEPIVESYYPLDYFWVKSVPLMQAWWILNPAILNQAELTCQCPRLTALDIIRPTTLEIGRT